MISPTLSVNTSACDILQIFYYSFEVGTFDYYCKLHPNMIEFFLIDVVLPMSFFTNTLCKVA